MMSEQKVTNYSVPVIFEPPCMYIYIYIYIYIYTHTQTHAYICKLRLKCEGTRAKTRFRLSAKRTSRYKSAGSSVQSTTGSRDVRISSSNAGYTMFLGRVKGAGYSLHLPVSPSLLLPCVMVCHHISTGLYLFRRKFCHECKDTHKTG